MRTDDEWRDEVLRRMLNTPPSDRCLDGKKKKKVLNQDTRFEDIEKFSVVENIIFERKCLNCQKTFKANGRFERLCSRCK